MRRLIPFLAVIAGCLGAATPALAATTVVRTADAVVITGDDAPSVVRVTQPDATKVAVQVLVGELDPAGGCAASDDTVTCDVAPGITADLGGGSDNYKASVDPPQAIDAGAGDDVIEAGYGKDVVLGGEGDDDLNGFRGDDRVDGGPGNDKVDGWDGSDTVVGGPGTDVLLGDGATIYPVGNDVIEARDGEVDSVDCGGGADRAVVDDADPVAACVTVERPVPPAPAPTPTPTPVVTTVVDAKPRKAPKLGAVARGTAIQLDVTASTSCTATVRLRVSGRQAKQLGFAKRARTLGTSKATPLAAGTATRVSVAVKRSARKRLRKARTVKATLAVSCGAQATDTASVTLRR